MAAITRKVPTNSRLSKRRAVKKRNRYGFPSSVGRSVGLFHHLQVELGLSFQKRSPPSESPSRRLLGQSKMCVAWTVVETIWALRLHPMFISGYHGQEVFAKEGAKENIRVVTLLYIAYNQFVTLAGSDVHQFEDIVGKKVAMGAAGSGSAQTLERLAKLAGIHGKFTPVYKGGTAGGDALRDRQVDGFQWLVNAPNSAIIYVSEIKSVRLIDFDAPAKKYGFYEKYPFYLPGTVPEKAYKNVQPVNTFMMPTVLIAHKDISEETVYTILQRIYDQAGHQTLITTTPAAKDMTPENAPKAFVIPLHRGAYRFWTERGVEIPAAAQAVD